MPRQLRIQYEHATYHVQDRGNRREAIFRDDRYRKEFLRRLETVCGKTGWSIRTYVGWVRKPVAVATGLFPGSLRLPWRSGGAPIRPNRPYRT